MEKRLGRKLKRSEVVHHKDGNGLNNNLNNLEIMSIGDHMRHHNTQHIGCKMLDCNRPHSSLGHCNKHYLRMYQRKKINIEIQK